MKQVALMGGVFALALLGSYVTWTADEAPEDDDDAVVVFHADGDSLKRLSLTSEEVDVALTRKTDSKGDYLWVEVVERKEKRAPNPVHPDHPPLPDDDETSDEHEGEEGEDAHDEEGEEAEPEVEIEITETAFAGNETAQETWEAFAPFLAIRELPATSGEVDVYGLAEPEMSIAVTRASGEITLEVGGEAYGTRHRYVAVSGSQYLVDHNVLRPLQYGKTRLVERRLYPFAEKDIEQIAVTRPGESRQFVQENRDDRATAFWADVGNTETEDVTGAAWLGKLLRVKVHTYDIDEGAEDTLDPVFTFTVTGGGESWPVAVLQQRDAEKPDFYAQPAFNRTLVKLTKGAAREVIADLDELFRGPAPADEEPAEEAAPEEEAPVADGEPSEPEEG